MPNRKPFPNNPKQKDTRRFLRQHATPAEEILWRHLRNNQSGHKFRRQFSLLGFIADFYCHALRLVIEVDGWTHDFEKTQNRDRIKQATLERAGYKVIRFRNEEVYGDIEVLLNAIDAACRVRAEELISRP